MIKDELVAPVVKWAGGKRQLADQIKKYIPKSFSTYYEPFLGGGAILFELQPLKAAVNDQNRELINVYAVIKNNVDKLIGELGQHKNEKEYFYMIRGLDRVKHKYEKLTAIQRAARIIYLNKTCFNGLFRVNKAGQFNTPFGDYQNPNIVNEQVLRAVSGYFNRAGITLTCADFEEALIGVQKGDFVYLDPPYDPVSPTAGFTGYDRDGFDRFDQLRLKETCDKLTRKGIKFLLSNSATDYVKNLYRNYRIETVRAKRPINARADRRGEIDEVLIMN